MDQRRYQFLVAVLGPDGAQALRKAAERLEDLEHALVPRTVLAWLTTASRFDYQGEIPGVPHSHVSFTKAEAGYTGSIAIGHETFYFEKGDLYHIGAAVCVALGMEPGPIATGVRAVDLERLGKSLDTMVKARAVAEELKEAEEGSGLPAIPKPPEAPAAPTSTAPAPTKPKLPRSSKAGIPKPAAPVPSTTLKLSEAEGRHPCSMCGGVQIKDGQFRGCLCFRGLSKGVEILSDQLGYVLKLGSDWDSEAVTTLLETVGRKGP